MSRTQKLVVAVVLGLGLIPIAVLGLFIYISATTIPLHPNAQDVTSVSGATPVRQWAKAVDQGREVVRAAVSEQNLPGVSVAVAAGGEMAWAEGFGWANIESKAPVSPETRFRIGTASTALTSAAVGLLLEKGQLKLDEKIQTYIPEFPEKEWPVTLRQLMGHLAGVRNDGGDEGPLFSQRCDRAVEGLQYFNDRSLLFEPGTQYRYSSFGWVVVSAAVEAAAGRPFLSFMRSQILEPLGMDHTETDSESPDRATSYFPRFAGDPRYGPDPMRPIELSCYAGSSVFLSTPSDLVRFAIAINSGKLLQPATVQLLQTSQRLANGDETGYGLGWDLETVTIAGKPTRAVGHNGDLLGGMAASLRTFPEHGIVVAVTTNTSYADTAGLAATIAEVFAAARSSR